MRRLIVLMALLSILAGCAGSNVPLPLDQQIIGTWREVRIEYADPGPSGDLATAEQTHVEYIYTYTPEGYRVVHGKGLLPGCWKINTNQISVMSSLAGHEEAYTVVIDGDTMTFSDADDPPTVARILPRTFTRVDSDATLTTEEHEQIVRIKHLCTAR